MAAIALNGIRRVHEDGTVALDGVDLIIEEGEVLGIIGPSGSGKSTLLRVIAGLDPLAAGVVRIGGTDVTHLRTRERNLSFVAQQRSLYAYLTVAQNLAFPLQVRKMEAEEVGRRVASERRSFRLSDIWRRRPKQLSAGQAQLTAMARAMVRLPDALLLDEPLQLLDPVEQSRLRAELQRLHRARPVTTLYTTNDHGAILGLADRVAVLHEGRVVQVDAPHRLLARPRNRFVAGFVGEPAMTFVDATIEDDAGLGWLVVSGQRLRFPGGLPGPLRQRAGSTVTLGARPDLVRGSTVADPVDVRLEGNVVRTEALGHVDHVTVAVPAGEWVAAFPPGSGLRPGDRVEVTVAVRDLWAFDPSDGSAVWYGDRAT